MMERSSQCNNDNNSNNNNICSNSASSNHSTNDNSRSSNEAGQTTLEQRRTRDVAASLINQSTCDEFMLVNRHCLQEVPRSNTETAPAASEETIARYSNQALSLKTRKLNPSPVYGFHRDIFFIDVVEPALKTSTVRTGEFHKNDHTIVEITQSAPPLYESLNLCRSNGNTADVLVLPTYQSLRNSILQDEPPKYEKVTGKSLTAELVRLYILDPSLPNKLCMRVFMSHNYNGV